MSRSHSHHGQSTRHRLKSGKCSSSSYTSVPYPLYQTRQKTRTIIKWSTRFSLLPTSKCLTVSLHVAHNPSTVGLSPERDAGKRRGRVQCVNSNTLIVRVKDSVQQYYSGPYCVRNCQNSGPYCVRNCQNSGPYCVRNCQNSGPYCVRNCQNSGPYCVRNCHNSGPYCVRNYQNVSEWPECEAKAKKCTRFCSSSREMNQLTRLDGTVLEQLHVANSLHKKSSGYEQTVGMNYDFLMQRPWCVSRYNVGTSSKKKFFLSHTLQ